MGKHIKQSRPRPGRPPGPTGTARGEVLRVRCTEGDLEQWRAAAERDGVTLSAWVRERLDTDARIGECDE